MGAVASTMGSWSPSDNTVKIECGDAHMAEVDGQDAQGNTIRLGYRDTLYPTAELIPEQNPPCTMEANGRYPTGFTYRTHLPPGQGPRFVIVLCRNDDTTPESNAAAMKLPHSSSGTAWATFNWQGYSIDYPSTQYTSYVALHEFMHTIEDGHYRK